MAQPRNPRVLTAAVASSLETGASVGMMGYRFCSDGLEILLYRIFLTLLVKRSSRPIEEDGD
jgi:hypothetical protein